jgi:hypothetical protein
MSRSLLGVMSLEGNDNSMGTPSHNVTLADEVPIVTIALVGVALILYSVIFYAPTTATLDNILLSGCTFPTTNAATAPYELVLEWLLAFALFKPLEATRVLFLCFQKIISSVMALGFVQCSLL